MYKHRQPERGSAAKAAGTNHPTRQSRLDKGRRTERTRKGVMPVAHMEERRG